MHNIIITVLIKSLLKSVIRKKMWKYWGCHYFLFQKKMLKRFSSAMYLSSHRQAGTPVTNTQSSHRAAPDMWKNVPFIVLFCSNGNQCTTSKQ